MTYQSAESERQEVRVLLIEDQMSVRVGLRLFFECEPAARVVGEAATARDGIALVASLFPDVVIMDLELPDLNGIEAAVIVKELDPCCVVIALTIHDCPETRRRAVAAGVWAFVAKGSPGDLRAAFRSARRALPGALRFP